jgi:hypothetical protein
MKAVSGFSGMPALLMRGSSDEIVGIILLINIQKGISKA